MESSEKIELLRSEIGKAVVGQNDLVDGMLVGLLTGGHILLEGRPGLGKTLAVKTLARCVGGSFSRIQFTPDLLPSDIVGYQSYRAEERRLEVQPGPVLANLVLADEINRAPAKVQSALLEAMEEHQVTIAGRTFALPEPFLVVATENPLEQQGTYALPEAQKDRFLLEIRLGYPRREEESEVLSRMGCGAVLPEIRQVVTCDDILALRKDAESVHLDGRLREYILDLVIATRPGERGCLSGRQSNLSFDALGLIEHGASPRAGIGLVRASKARALLHGRRYVLPEDIRALAVPVLGHRVIVSFEAEAQRLDGAAVIERMAAEVAAP